MLRTLTTLCAVAAASLALAGASRADGTGPAPSPAPVLAPLPSTLYAALPTLYVDLHWSASTFDATAWFRRYVVRVKSFPTAEPWREEYAYWDYDVLDETVTTDRIAVRPGYTYVVGVTAEQTFICIISCVWERSGGPYRRFAVEPVPPPPIVKKP
jgi:hypothetical protein